MIDQLKNSANTNELIEIYTDADDLSVFGVGKVLKVSSEWVALAYITPTGFYDGYRLIRIEDIIRLNFKSKYISKIRRLYAAKKQNHIQYSGKDEDMVLDLLNFAQINNFVVSFQLLDSDYFNVQGYIETIKKDILVIKNVNDFGELDGESYIKLEDINRISCDDDDEYCLKILSSQTPE